MAKHYPCDTEPFDCPFGARYSDDCRYYCGLGVDEYEPDEEPKREDFYEDLHLEQTEQM